MDLFGQLSAPAAPPAPPDPFAAGDLLGGGGVGGAGAPAAAPAPAGPPAVATPVHDPQVLFHRLLAADSGVLYEDQYVQVGCKAEWKPAPASGVVTLFIGNKHPAPLEAVSVSLAAVQGLRLSCTPAPPTLAAQEQVQVAVDLALQQPFPLNTAPTLALCYRPAGTSGGVSITARLPAVACKFLAAAPPMEKTRFYEAWRALAGPPVKLDAVLSVNAQLQAGGLKAWESLFAGLRLYVVPEVDPNPLNLFAASTLEVESGAPVLCIVRLESDANSKSVYRITVASANAVLTAAVKETICALAAV